MITFYPTWRTPSGIIANIIENQTISINLDSMHSAQLMGSDILYQNEINLIDANIETSLINSVYINNKSVSYTIVDKILLLNNIMVSNTDIIVINASTAISYSSLYNSLPDGLNLSNNGIISGTIQTKLSTNEQVYTFAARISDGTYVRDREFSIVVDIANSITFPPSWGKLPPKKIKSTAPEFSYVPLGSSTRSNLFEFQLDIFEPNNIPPILKIESFFNSQVHEPFNTIPSGLSIDPNTGLIRGIVSPDVQFGDYYFNILMKDFLGNPITVGNSSFPLTCNIRIDPSNTALQPYRLIFWETPSGSLASMYESQDFPLSVNATCSTGEPVSYRLVNNTSLPAGLTLNYFNGNIEGTLLHVSDVNVTYDFIVRANVLNVFEDRNFSITVLSKYNSSSFLDFYFKIRTIDSKYMTNYYSSVIDPSYYFRSSDNNFGILNPNFLKIYIIGGLNGTVDTIDDFIRASKINGPINLTLGKHKVANVNINGNTIYEVLYREVIDSMDGAGGYITNTGVPVKEPLLYPESDVNNPIYITPNSINNIRNEFALGLKFPSYNTKLLGINSAENLPQWMESPQANNDQTTAIGYVPAMVIAYLSPGNGKNVLDSITVRSEPNELVIDDSDPIRTGHTILFDQYQVEFKSISRPTSFYSDRTSFDNALTLDSYPYISSNLFRIAISTVKGF